MRYTGMTYEEACVVSHARALVGGKLTLTGMPDPANIRWIDKTKVSGRYYHDLVSRAYAICDSLGTKSLFSPQVFGWPKEVTG